MGIVLMARQVMDCGRFTVSLDSYDQGLTVIQTRPNGTGLSLFLISLTSSAVQELPHEYVQDTHGKHDLTSTDTLALTHREGVAHRRKGLRLASQGSCFF